MDHLLSKENKLLSKAVRQIGLTMFLLTSIYYHYLFSLEGSVSQIYVL